MLKIFTWLVFALCCLFAFYVLWFSVGHAIAPEVIRGSDSAIGFFWMNVFGFFPAVVLWYLIWRQRFSVRRAVLGFWLAPALILLCTSAYMAALAV